MFLKFCSMGWDGMGWDVISSYRFHSFIMVYSLKIFHRNQRSNCGVIYNIKNANVMYKESDRSAISETAAHGQN